MSMSGQDLEDEECDTCLQLKAVSHGLGVIVDNGFTYFLLDRLIPLCEFCNILFF